MRYTRMTENLKSLLERKQDDAKNCMDEIQKYLENKN